MLISTRKIPAEGLDLAFEVPVAVMRTGMAPDDEESRTFDGAVSCRVHLTIDRQDVFLSGEAATALHPTCARCGETFERPIQVELALTCSPQRGFKGSDSYQESDEGIVFYHHEQLDLTEIVREQILLTLPMRHLCREDCRGLCPACGANLNHGEHVCAKVARQ